jgi:hypothetical protein
MKRALAAVAMLLAVAPLTGTARQSDAAKHEITFHGCVIPGQDKGTYAVTQVVEVPGPGGSTMPEVAHGRRVLFWLKNDDNVKKHIGRMVEVRGDFTGLQESEVELKAGRQNNGELVVEFEGPGKDVKVPNSSVGDAIGTAGRTVPEKDDVKTYLAYVNVKQVRVTSGNCQ